MGGARVEGEPRVHRGAVVAGDDLEGSTHLVGPLVHCGEAHPRDPGGVGRPVVSDQDVEMAVVGLEGLGRGVVDPRQLEGGERREAEP